MKFITELDNLKDLLTSKPTIKDSGKKLRDYGYGQIDFHKKSIESCKKNIISLGFELAALYKYDQKNKDAILEILNIINGDFLDKVDELQKIAKTLKFDEKKSLVIKVPPNIPSAINPDISADLREFEKSFNSGCYRAATILLGRILETCLHRKYYEATGVDILEKNPGIGLGKLIARLLEKKVSFDPGLTQQIHLINQVRIHSVHVKKVSFYPSEQQTYAMILYTMDVLEKMF